MNLYEAVETICKDYCKYPDIESGNKLADICDKCPMNKCEDLRWVDRKTENSSEIPNNCEDEFKLFDREALILLIECQKERIAELLAKDEPQTDIAEDIVRSYGFKAESYQQAKAKDEPQYDFGEYADRLWKIAYERGKREALEQTEPSCDTCKLKDTTEWCKRQEVCRAYQPKDEPQTCSVNGRPYSECGSCEHFRCTADEPQTEVIMPKKCKGCDSASKIIEAYSKGFEDGADAVKAMPDCPWK